MTYTSNNLFGGNMAEAAVIDGKYQVVGQCSNAGGMGTLLYVKPANGTGPFVLKLCKLTDPEMLARFRREVRVMQAFNGNGYVMPILDANLDHEPPYFVMPNFAQGDLMNSAAQIRSDMARLEFTFQRMIDCLMQLHGRGVMHRDIKPQNFLLGEGGIVISDLGLCSEAGTTTAFTRSSQWAGTPGYLPPESVNGGFKDADPATDIFMLGKAFYVLLSGRDPMYLIPDGLPPQLFPILERCCAVDKRSRYQSLASLRQSLESAFDVLLGRVIGPGRTYAVLRSIADRLRVSQQFIPDEIGQFVEELSLLVTDDQQQVCFELPPEAFSVLSQAVVRQHLGPFIAIYRRMVEDATYSWSYAETIAGNMAIVFNAPDPAPADKAEALRIAIIAATRQNRFAAMDTCSKLISAIEDAELAQRVHDVLIEHDASFIQGIEPSACKAPAIRQAIHQLRAAANNAA